MDRCPLSQAITRDDIAIARYFVDCGAYLTSERAARLIPFSHSLEQLDLVLRAATSGISPKHLNPVIIRFAFSRGHTMAMTRALLERAELDYTDDECDTLLSQAVRTNQEQLLSLLVELGANPHERNKSDATSALELAMGLNQQQLVSAMLKRRPEKLP